MNVTNFGYKVGKSKQCTLFDFHQLEEPLLTTAKEKMMVLAKAVTDPDTANSETKFVEDAVQQLLKGRRVLKCSYVYGFYLQETGYKKPIFEFMQVIIFELLHIPNEKRIWFGMKWRQRQQT